MLDIARRIVTDPQVIRDLAGEVSEAIFSTSLREQLRLALVSTLAQRLDAHGKATAALTEVREELTQRWRIAQGGRHGKPTPTKELVAVHQALVTEVRQTEDILAKTVKMAIEEFRSQKGDVAIGGGLDPLRFTGSAEALPIPAEVGPGDREAIRQLWGMFDKAIQAKRTLTAEHGGSRPAEGSRPLADAGADSLPALPPQTEPPEQDAENCTGHSAESSDDDNSDSAADPAPVPSPEPTAPPASPEEPPEPPAAYTCDPDEPF